MYTNVYVCIYDLAKVNVSICLFMYVYACIILSACICTYNSEYVRICMYMRICTYISCICVYARIYFQKVIYVKNGCGYHSHTGTMAEVITLHCGDGCSRPENAKGDLIHFEYLFAIKFQERTSSHVL